MGWGVAEPPNPFPHLYCLPCSQPAFGRARSVARWGWRCYFVTFVGGKVVERWGRGGRRSGHRKVPFYPPSLGTTWRNSAKQNGVEERAIIPNKPALALTRPYPWHWPEAPKVGALDERGRRSSSSSSSSVDNELKDMRLVTCKTISNILVYKQGKCIFSTENWSIRFRFWFCPLFFRKTNFPNSNKIAGFPQQTRFDLGKFVFRQGGNAANFSTNFRVFRNFSLFDERHGANAFRFLGEFSTFNFTFLSLQTVGTSPFFSDIYNARLYNTCAAPVFS